MLKRLHIISRSHCASLKIIWGFRRRIFWLFAGQRLFYWLHPHLWEDLDLNAAKLIFIKVQRMGRHSSTKIFMSRSSRLLRALNCKICWEILSALCTKLPSRQKLIAKKESLRRSIQAPKAHNNYYLPLGRYPSIQSIVGAGHKANICSNMNHLLIVI